MKLIDATYSGKPLPAALQRTNTYGQFDTLEKMLVSKKNKKKMIFLVLYHYFVPPFLMDCLKLLPKMTVLKLY